MTNLNVILEGAGGNDTLTLIGGAKKDVLNGNDTLRENRGSNIFVLGSAMGADFSDGVDYLQLTTSLGFANLDISNNPGSTGILIRDTTDKNKLLATVNNLDASDLTEVDFI